MNFVLNRDDLLKPLQSMLSVANSKSTMPLLSCILFDISNNNLKIRIKHRKKWRTNQ